MDEGGIKGDAKLDGDRGKAKLGMECHFKDDLAGDIYRYNNPYLRGESTLSTALRQYRQLQ